MAKISDFSHLDQTQSPQFVEGSIRCKILDQLSQEQLCHFSLKGRILQLDFQRETLWQKLSSFFFPTSINMDLTKVSIEQTNSEIFQLRSENANEPSLELIIREHLTDIMQSELRSSLIKMCKTSNFQEKYRVSGFLREDPLYRVRIAFHSKRLTQTMGFNIFLMHFP
jgi:hypothetical protein